MYEVQRILDVDLGQTFASINADDGALEQTTPIAALEAANYSTVHGLDLGRAVSRKKFHRHIGKSILDLVNCLDMSAAVV